MSADLPPKESPHEILIVKPSSLGDVVHTLPAVACVRRAWPEARIRWLINPEWAPLLEGNPDIDEVVIFPRGEFRGWRGMTRLLPWIQKIRREVQADLVLDFQGLLRSALVAKLCRRAGGKIAGLSDAREGAGLVYDYVAEVSGGMHAVDRYLKLVESLGVPLRKPLRWPLPQGSCPAGFTAPERFVLLHPFSRGAGKSLTAHDVREFCQSVAPRQVVIAGRTDVAIPPMENTTDLLNRTSLQELIWLIRQAQFVVSVDSGPMHIAAALTCNLLSIHTWSDPAKVGPYRRDAWVWKDAEVFRRAAPEESRAVTDIRGLGVLVNKLLEKG